MEPLEVVLELLEVVLEPLEVVLELLEMVLELLEVVLELLELVLGLLDLVLGLLELVLSLSLSYLNVFLVSAVGVVQGGLGDLFMFCFILGIQSLDLDEVQKINGSDLPHQARVR